ncbi:AAA family ATPase [Tranquillimonas alkanivorans]|uniref:AAA domain-containing protein n=1 Tax=Tranquillimonas alkanivorans TaxID=441119 RepID=A0A1I5VSC0_9RHOB|nr:AAA family ATPase [Tranquillimonas alkanivorans]SFQ10468.1 AAA domain-containing protein [Tranquillimonas alkanivorans]
MTEHLYLCQTQDVADRVRALGYDARPWDIATFPGAYRDRSLILVPHFENVEASREVHLISELATEAGAAAVRVLSYPCRPYIMQNYNLSRGGEPHDFLARQLLERAQDQEPLRPPAPDLTELSIADQFDGEPPVQKWLVGAPTAQGGLLPDAAPILLAGRGGIGKTHAATELAILVGTWDGRAPAPLWMGHEIAKAGAAVVITYEEHRATMHRKVHKLCRHHGVDLTEGRRVIVLSMSDPRFSGGPLLAPDPRTRRLAATENCTWLTRQLRKVHAELGGLGVIVLDHAGRAFEVEGNSYSDANAAMGLMDRWATEFACPVITLAHTRKTVIKPEMDDEEILQAVMGSAGWVSAVRATMVMWQLTAKDEAELADKMNDRDFQPGITRRKYLQAQVLKHNVDDLYDRRLTLKRRGATLDDISDGVRNVRQQQQMHEMKAFAEAVGAQWHRDAPMQSTGKHGVFENKGRLGEPWSNMPKSKLRHLIKACIGAHLLERRADHPALGKLSQGAWLRRPETDGTVRLGSGVDDRQAA